MITFNITSFLGIAGNFWEVTTCSMVKSHIKITSVIFSCCHRTQRVYGLYRSWGYQVYTPWIFSYAGWSGKASEGYNSLKRKEKNTPNTQIFCVTSALHCKSIMLSRRQMHGPLTSVSLGCKATKIFDTHSACSSVSVQNTSYQK